VSKSARPIDILQVSASERGGGAETMAREMHRRFRERGHNATLVVGRGTASGQHVQALGEGRDAGLQHMLAGPLRVIDRQRGLETYRYPRSRSLLEQLSSTPDIVHLHNLHGGYFDLRYLTGLSTKVPVTLTLHDAWLLSGHCAHSFDCERWRTGCGSCPDLSIYPSIRRDATALNWQRKRDIFVRSRLYAATPSNWLADRVRSSMLAPALAQLRVIPNGVDLETFAPGDRRAARAAFGLAADEPVLLVVGSASADNPFRDFELAQRAAAGAAVSTQRTLTMVVIGATAAAGSDAVADNAPGAGVALRYVPFVDDVRDMARWYQAADLSIHAARADTFPTSVVEALACGLPVVATAVGGIPEQITPMPADNATGALVPAGDTQAMAAAIAAILDDDALRTRLGASAARDAALRFDIRRQCDDYLAWYRSILEKRE
jgi:glycosyltransferase involved in cell wall biosynthesis